MTSSQNDVDDELARRFRQVFNKEPVSQAQEEQRWTVAGGDDFDIDDEEVNTAELIWWLMVVGKVDGGECCVG